MATAPRRTTYTSGQVVSANAAYGESYKLTLPFNASRVSVSVISSSGTDPLLYLSFDGVTDCATLHGDKTSGAGTYVFELQEVSTLYYKQSANNIHFVVNAEIKAWPTTIG